MEQPAVYLLTGPMAAGKSTVARLLASRFERGVYLEGDLFRRSIVSGREEMTPAPSAEALKQLRLRYSLAAAAADGYLEAGFGVALEDVVAGPLLSEYSTMIRSRPCHVVVLLPSRKTVAVREAERQDKGYDAWTIGQLYDLFVSRTPRIGLWLDTTDLTPEQTVEQILTQTSPPERRPNSRANDRSVAWASTQECSLAAEQAGVAMSHSSAAVATALSAGRSAATGWSGGMDAL